MQGMCLRPLQGVPELEPDLHMATRHARCSSSVSPHTLSPFSFACRVDEIHMLVGAGAVSSRGGLDVSNLMKPALARGEISCIGATTLDEHRRYIERDTALERRFQPVMVDEASPEETLVILRGLKVGPSLF